MYRVNNEKLTKVKKRRLWNEIIQDYLLSGETVRAYSKSKALKCENLAYYVHK